MPSTLESPRRWQAEALHLWLQRRRGVVSVVTGGGKTMFALQCFQAARAEVPDLRLAVIVPTLALLDQWVVALQLDLGLPEADTATYSGEGKADTPRLGNVLVINTARELLASVVQSGRWMLVVDECHRAGSAENARALEGEFVAVLGLSATPERQFDDGFARFIEPRLGPVIFEYDYASARIDGVIAPFEVHNIRFPLTEAEQERYDAVTRRIRRYARYAGEDRGSKESSPMVEALLRQRARVSIAAQWRIPTAIAALRGLTGKAIVFHERIAAAEEIAAVLNKGDRRPTTYHSKIYGPTRRERLRLFRLGVYDTLVTCRSLDEGLNVPDASIAVIVASTSSRRQRIQRLGRVLRVADAAKRAIVVTLYATPVEERHLRLEEARLVDVAAVRWYEAAGING